MATILDLQKVSKNFGAVTALSALDLSLPDNEYVSLLGPSGSGKTTLLRVIAGFDRPDFGRVVFRGQRIEGTAPHRRDIGFVFQNFALFPHLSVARNVAFGLENRAISPLTDRRVVSRRVKDMVRLVGLEGLEDRAVTQISGGQRQRVALARTLIMEPGLVLLDEPLGALDANLRTRMRTELRAIRERCGVTFLHVTGSENEALAMGDTVLVLDNGAIAQAAGAETVYNRPVSPSVARFLNCYNLFDGRVSGSVFVTSVGDFPLARGEPRSVGEPAYAIRHDRISVRFLKHGIADDEVGLPATFIAGEYSGASVISFFSLSDGRLFEVETHLSQNEAPQFKPQSRHLLVWKRSEALVYS